MVESKICGCSPFERGGKESANTLKIRWKRLVTKRETCPRCGSTEEELNKAVSALKQSIAPIGIRVLLEREELSVTKFRLDPSQSNRIWIDDHLLEEWIGTSIGRSPCCDVCGPHDCRTVEVEGRIYETIPAELVIKAGLLAASQLVGPHAGKMCCEGA